MSSNTLHSPEVTPYTYSERETKRLSNIIQQCEKEKERQQHFKNGEPAPDFFTNKFIMSPLLTFITTHPWITFILVSVLVPVLFASYYAIQPASTPSISLTLHNWMNTTQKFLTHILYPSFPNQGSPSESPEDPLQVQIDNQNKLIEELQQQFATYRTEIENHLSIMNQQIASQQVLSNLANDVHQSLNVCTSST